MYAEPGKGAIHGAKDLRHGDVYLRLGLVWYVHNTAANFSNVDLSLGWNHVVLTHTDGSTPTLYLNGTSYTGSQTITWNSDTSAVLRIGRTEVASESFNGTIDEVRIADTIHTACYIKAQYNNQIWPDASVTPSPDPTPNPSCGFYNPGIETTEVDLASFSAHGVDGAVELEWETATELDNIGFQLYRSESEAGPFERITPSAIPGLGSSVVGASYAYRDTNVTNGTSYYYELEDIETTGRTERHGPVRATPRAGETSLRDEPDDGEPPPSDSEEALITYGEPSSSTWRVTPRGRDQILIELDTRGFYALPQEDGSVRLSIPGFVELGEADGPALPVKRQWVEAIAGRKVELVSVMARDGTVRAMNRRARTAFRGEGLSPSSAARLLEVGFQGEVKKALVELAPLRWDAARGQLLLARRLVVRVSFRTPDPSEEATRGRRGRRYRRRRSHDERSVAKRLVTTEQGLYAVRYEDVMSGSRSVSARSLRLSRQGKAVAFHLEPNRPRFQPGSTLYFKSVAIEDVYAEFGFGETSPEALRDFLSYAYHKWRRPSLRYVVLLGDATYDFKDYLETGIANQVPPLIVKTTYMWTASDPGYAAVNGEDLLPDIALGRLAASTVGEAEEMVAKILGYERSCHRQRRQGRPLRTRGAGRADPGSYRAVRRS